MTMDEQIKALKKYDRIRITIKDMDMVRPESRGATIECTFSQLENNSHEGLIVWCEGNDDALSILHHDDVPSYKIAKLGFHEWLIESLEVIE